MTSFKNFFFAKPEAKQSPSAIGSSNLAVSVAAVSVGVVAGLSSTHNMKGLVISNSERETFGNQIGEMVGSEDFISELSIRLGSPKANESEDDFVARAKQSMRNLLKDKLKG